MTSQQTGRQVGRQYRKFLCQYNVQTQNKTLTKERETKKKTISENYFLNVQKYFCAERQISTTTAPTQLNHLKNNFVCFSVQWKLARSDIILSLSLSLSLYLSIYLSQVISLSLSCSLSHTHVPYLRLSVPPPLSLSLALHVVGWNLRLWKLGMKLFRKVRKKWNS